MTTVLIASVITLIGVATLIVLYFRKRNRVVEADKPKGSRTKHHRFDMENNPIIYGLDYVHAFIDACIIRISWILLMVGFVMGTIDILTPSFHLTTQDAFTGTWAVVQALALDGLFFGVWTRFREAREQGEKWRYYAIVGVLLGMIAGLINATLAYQQLKGVDSITAMARLNIDPVGFLYFRSILVIVVSILITTLPKSNRFVESMREEIQSLHSQIAEMTTNHDTALSTLALQIENERASHSEKICSLTEKLQLVSVNLEQTESRAKRLAEKAESIIESGLENFSKVKTEWLDRGIKSVTLEDIVEVTGLSMRSVGKVKAFKKAPKSNNKYTVQSVIDWLKSRTNLDTALSRDTDNEIEIVEIVPLEEMN